MRASPPSHPAFRRRRAGVAVGCGDGAGRQGARPCPREAVRPVNRAADEWVDRESVEQIARVLVATTLDWCGVV